MQPLTVKPTKQVEFDLCEVLAEGLPRVYEEPGDLVQATRAAIRFLRGLGYETEARRLEHSLELDRPELIAARVCPLCGAGLEVECENQRHDYGAMTVVERRAVLRCPEHGEV